MKFSLIVILGVAIVAAVNSASKLAEQTQTDEQLTVENPRTKHFRLDKDRLAIDG